MGEEIFGLGGAGGRRRLRKVVAATDEAGTGGLGVMITEAGIGISGALSSLKRRSKYWLSRASRETKPQYQP